jgi:hypothetical protein
VRPTNRVKGYTRPGNFRNRPKVGHIRREYQTRNLQPILIAGGIALVLILVLVVSSIVGSHPAIGKWRKGIFVLNVYKDHVATANSVVCSWQRIGQSSIRIKPSAAIDVPDAGSVEFAFELTVQENGQQAVLDAFGFPLILERDGKSK